MSQNPVVHDTFTIERIYKATPERVFAAWADPVQKRHWFAEGEQWLVESFEADFSIGGFERSRFRVKDGLVAGAEIRNETVHHDIIPDRRIVSSYSMAFGEQRFSVSLATVEIEPSGAGTLLRFTEQAAFFEGADGIDRRREGWSELFDRLANEIQETL